MYALGTAQNARDVSIVAETSCPIRSLTLLPKRRWTPG